MTTATLPGSTTAPLRPTRAPRESIAVDIPPSAARSLAGFRAWYATDDFPEHGRIEYLAGRLFIDMGHERLSSHVSLKGELTKILLTLTEGQNLGQFFTDGVRLVNEGTDLSCEPDGCYLTWAAVTAGRVRLQRSADGKDVTEVVGAPEMVLEILSPSSVQKDRTYLKDLFHRTGILEYWLLDAMDDEIEFSIFRSTTDGYEPEVPAEGWLTSTVFGRKFRLNRVVNPIGLWKYTLHVAPLDAAP